MQMHPSLQANCVFTDLLTRGRHHITATYTRAVSVEGRAAPPRSHNVDNDVSSSPHNTLQEPVRTTETSHRASIVHTTFARYPPYPPAQYPANWSTDTTGGGAWQQHHYGTAGYQLFGFYNTSDATSLPRWVHSVTIHRGTTYYVGASATNASYLEPPAGVRQESSGEAQLPRAPFEGVQLPQAPSGGQMRRLGFVTDGADGSQGTVLDINVTAGHRCARGHASLALCLTAACRVCLHMCLYLHACVSAYVQKYP